VVLAIRAWNMLGGMEWAGIEVVAEVLGYDDLEVLVTQLQTIRAFQSTED
jgi:hypothetical protein